VFGVTDEWVPPSCVVPTSTDTLQFPADQNMESVVLQLQRECLDVSVPILDILRRASVVARKLSLTDAQTWIEKELKGYQNGDAPPPHRLLKGRIQVRNPYHGWQPVMFQNPVEADTLSKCFVGQPIGELEHLTNSGNSDLEFPFDPATLNRLMKGIGVPLPPTRILDAACIRGILDAVRNMLLEWTMKLEEDGITGEGLTFSSQEKETASRGHYTINYNGPVANSQIQQGSQGATQAMSVAQSDLKSVGEFIADLKSQITALQLNPADGAQLKADADAVNSQLASPRPNRIVIDQLLVSITTILEGCAGNLLASGLFHKLTGLGG
jgi:hypothetical protein